MQQLFHWGKKYLLQYDINNRSELEQHITQKLCNKTINETQEGGQALLKEPLNYHTSTDFTKSAVLLFGTKHVQGFPLHFMAYGLCCDGDGELKLKQTRTYNQSCCVHILVLHQKLSHMLTPQRFLSDKFGERAVGLAVLAGHY